jgi:uncharacterized membrane protein YccC
MAIPVYGWATNRAGLASNKSVVASLAALTASVRNTGPALLFALRLWASVCLDLYIAFWLELDNPFWAGASAAVVCLPQLGASLRKGWFRMIGTIVGATVIVVLTALFPQNRIAFLGLLALWGALCAFVATILRNFTSYAAALAGYTAAIIAADTLGATGGASPEVFWVAVWRASEISIGILCAGIVLAGTDLGGARRQLATLLSNLATEIAGHFSRMVALRGPQLPDTQMERREYVRRAIALDPIIDQVLGESSDVRCRAPILQGAVHGLFRSLDGWRGVATHLGRLPADMDWQAETILHSIPPELQSATATSWTTDPLALKGDCEAAARTLLSLPGVTPSLRLLADETAKVLGGMMRVLDALALLSDAPGRLRGRGRGFRLSVPDWLPPLVNAGRAFVAIGAVELFWIATAWPDGASTLVFVTALLLLISPRGDLAYHASIAFALGVVGTVVCAAIIEFAVLPSLNAFPAFCLALGLFFIPVGYAMARSQQTAAFAVFSAMGLTFLPLLTPTNPMSYDTVDFYNAALAIVVGCGVAPLAFRLLPPLSPARRARRLLQLTLRDLQRLTVSDLPPALEDWESRMYSRLAAMPDQADPLQRARMLAALSVGTEIVNLRHMAPRLGVVAKLDAALKGFAQKNSTIAVARLHQLDHHIATSPNHSQESIIASGARSRIMIMSEAISEHAAYFDSVSASAWG